jgi:hypothetical protein
VFSCDLCGCLFLPDDDGEGFYPDRYIKAVGPDLLDPDIDDPGRVDGGHNCVCHNAPYRISTA